MSESDTRDLLEKFLGTIKEKETSILGRGPDISLKPLSKIPTLQERLYNATLNPMLSDQERKLVIGKIFGENSQKMEKNPLAAMLAGVGTAAVAPRIMDLLSAGALSRKPYLNQAAGGGTGGGKTPLPGNIKNLPKDERMSSKVLKDFLKFFGTTFMALSMARIFAKRSGMYDLRSPVKDSNVNIWNLMNK